MSLYLASNQLVGIDLSHNTQLHDIILNHNDFSTAYPIYLYYGKFGYR